MLYRPMFVTNSSSSAYLYWGVSMNKEQMLAALRPHLSYGDYEEAKESDDYDLGELVVDKWRTLASIVESRWDTVDAWNGGEHDDFVFFAAK